MRIGWDLDGVLANFVGAYLALYVHPVNDGISEQDVVESSVQRQVKAFGHGRIVDAAEAADDNLFELVEVHEDILATLRAVDADHCFITTRPSNAVMQTYRWFAKHDIPFHSGIFFAKDGKEKAELSRQLQVDVFIDDYPENIVSVAPHVTHAVILDRPWNRSAITYPANVVRVHDAHELRRFLENAR